MTEALQRRINTEIGRTVRKRRLQMALTMMEVAAEIGFTHQMVQKWETGKANFTVYHLTLLARALEVEVSALLPRSS